MRAQGSQWGFYVEPVPDWIPRQTDARAWREYHVAVEDDGCVRGGYALKPQLWLINGEAEWVSDWQGPFTEGAIDRRFSALALRLLRDMLKKYPLLYSYGHGGGDGDAMAPLLNSLGWTMHPTPLCIRVVRPYRFLRRNAYLRKDPRRALLLDALAFSGAGAIGIRLMHALLRLRHSSGALGDVHATVVDEFGEWADDLWRNHAGAYRCLAVRDRNMMNELLPRTGWPGGTRLRIDRGGSVIGWAVVHIKQMNGDSRYGTLRAAQVSDCFAAPAAAAAVIEATHTFLAAQGVDIVCSNQSHAAWVDAFRASGYHVLPGRRHFAASPQLRSRMEPFADMAAGLHLTNLDGHGPHGFSEVESR
jgi:hypothetical protein